MEQEYDHDAVEKFIESIKSELEPKIIKELCRIYDVNVPYEIGSIKQFEMEIKFSLGFCHAIWNSQKRILKRDYNVEWKTPAELNPDVMMD